MLPIGFVHDAADRVVLDPDQHIQDVVRLFFATFERTGSCLATVKEFHTQQVAFPDASGAGRTRARWCGASCSTVVPDRSSTIPATRAPLSSGDGNSATAPAGKIQWKDLPQNEWILIPDTHVGYITWAAYEAHQQRVATNAAAWGDRSAPWAPTRRDRALAGIGALRYLRRAHERPLSLLSRPPGADVLVWTPCHAPRRARALSDRAWGVPRRRGRGCAR